MIYIRELSFGEALFLLPVQENGPFLGRGPVSTFVGQKKARISGRHIDSALDGQKKACFPGQFSIVRLET